jgi:serine/threonine-protein kinase HipA
LLATHARDEEAELTALTRAMTFTFLIGNADAHGKNLALLHDGAGHIRLAPLYDTVPTVLWPNLRASSAMSVNSIVAFDRMTLHDLATEASSWGLDYKRASTVASELASDVGDLVPAVIEHHELATRVLGQVERLLEDAPGPF